MKRRRGAGFVRGAIAAEALGILIMFDAIIAFAKRLSDDDNNLSAEIAGLETAKAAFEAKQATDEQALADLKARLDALQPADTSAFALKTDLPDFTQFATKGDVATVSGSLDDLNSQIAALSQPAAPASGPAPEATGAPATAEEINKPLDGGPITATSGQPDTTQPAADNTAGANADNISGEPAA